MKKGFTLVELLAVIVMLAIILAIAVPTISGLIDNTALSAYASNEKLMINATKNYLASNQGMPTTINNSVLVTLNQLQTNQFIGIINDVKNQPSTCDGYVVVRLSEKQTLEYTPYLNCGANYKTTKPITSGLVFDMPLGEYKSGSTYLNTLGTNNGTDNLTTLTSNRLGESNKASSFNGTTSYVALPSTTAIINNNNSFTITAWFNASAIGTYDYSNRVIALMRNTGASTAISLTLGLNNKARLLYADGLANHKYLDTTISLNTWYQLVATFNGSKYTLYLDGVKKNEVTDTFQGFSTGVARIGGMTSNLDYFNGAIDDITIYNRALTSDEVLYNYNVESIVGR